MYISKLDEYTDFKWYTGRSALDNTSGTWTIFKEPNDPVPLLDIEWHRDYQNDTGDITYTNVEPNGAENGGYITYGTTTDVDYNAFYNLYNKGEDNLVDIEWNRTTIAGRVANEKCYGNTNWQYWDENQEDLP